MELFLLIASAPILLPLLFFGMRALVDKKKLSKAQRMAATQEKEKQKRSDYLKQIIYSICQPDEYYHELLGASAQQFADVTEIIVNGLYPLYETINYKTYTSTQDLKNIYAEINKKLELLKNTYHIEIEYSDIPVLFQHLNDLLEKIFSESFFTINNNIIRALSEIRENEKCYCFCIEVDAVEDGYVSKINSHMILETDVKRSRFIPLDSSEKEAELLRRFKKQSANVRNELEKTAKNQSGDYNSYGTDSYAYNRTDGRFRHSDGRTYGNSSNHRSNNSDYSNSYSDSTNKRAYSYSKATQSSYSKEGQTTQKNSKTYNDNSAGPSQNEDSLNNDHRNRDNKNELELFIENKSKTDRYYRYFIGCKTFADVKKRRNELVKQFHPDMGNSNGEEINHINPIFDIIKKEFG